MSSKRARTTAHTPGTFTSYSRSRVISVVTQDTFRLQFLLRPVLFEREVIMSDLSPDLATIFTSRGWEPLLEELTLHSSLLVHEFYTNIHDVSGSNFRVFLRDRTVKITSDIILSLIHIPRVVHPPSRFCCALCAQICGQCRILLLYLWK